MILNKTVDELYDVKNHASAILAREAEGEPWFTAVGVGGCEELDPLFLYADDVKAAKVWMAKKKIKTWLREPVEVRLLKGIKPAGTDPVSDPPAYPASGTSQAELNAWIEAEIKRREAKAIEVAETEREEVIRKKADGTLDINAVYASKAMWFIKVFAIKLQTVFEGTGAPNSLQLELKPGGGCDKWKIILIKPGRKTPMDRLYDTLAKFTAIADELERKTALPPTELALLVKRLRDYATADVGKLPGEDGQP